MIADKLKALMQIPGLSGHEHRVAAAISKRMPITCETDTLGNLIATFPGSNPSVMLQASLATSTGLPPRYPKECQSPVKQTH